MSATTTTTATTSITTTVTAESVHGYDYVPRGPVSAELSFFVPPADGSVPYNYVEQPPEGKPTTNVVWQPREVRLDDIRGNESAYNLDKDAFQVHSGVQSATTYETFNSDEEVRRVYYPEVERLLLDKVDGAHKVILFDHTIRRQDPNAPRQPVNMAHGDQTDRATEWRVRLHVEDPAEAERLLQGRYRIINVWRPINGVVQSAPLAIASAACSGTPNKDMIPIEHRYPTRTGEILGVVYNPDTRWYYWSGVNDDERIFLKCSDINPPAGKLVGKRCPHTAFADPRTPDGAKPRESIEVRALVFG